MAVGSTAVMVSTDVLGATRIWGNTGTTFNDASSWEGGVLPTTVTADKGAFTAAPGTQPTLSSSFTINAVAFSVGANGFTLASNGDGSASLVLVGTGSSTTTYALYNNAGAGLANTINAPIVLGAAGASVTQFIGLGTSSTLNLNGTISSTGAATSLNYAGSGTANIHAANTYTGDTVQSAGSTLVVFNKAAFSGGAVSFNSTTSKIKAGVDLTGGNRIANNLKFGATGATLTVVDSPGLGIEFNGNFDLGAETHKITNQNTGGATFNGVFSNDSGAGITLSTSGSAFTTLTGSSTFTGTPTVIGGKLSISSIGNSGVAGNLGAGTAIALGDASTAGILSYTGTGESTTKTLRLNSAIQQLTIDHAGSGTLEFSSITVSAGAKTLSLSGSVSGTGLLSGSFSENGGAMNLTKTGKATWILSGTNTYSGINTVNDGKLLINGTHNNAGVYNVSATATLGGSGTINSNGTAGVAYLAGSTGKFDPIGTMTMALGTGQLSLTAIVSGANTQALQFALGTPTTNDKVVLTGSGQLVIGTGNLEFTDFLFTETANVALDQVYTLFDTNATSISGTVGSALTGVLTPTLNGVISVSGNDIILTVIPEPAGLSLLGLAGVGLLGRRRAKATI